MKGVIALFLVVLAVVVSAEVDLSVSPVYDYHRRHGIPRAAEIRAREEATVGQRIVGGSVVDISTVPYQVGLIMQILWVFSSICGGSLVSSNRIVTAAHCKFDGNINAQSFTAVLGSNAIFFGGERLNVHVDDVVMHPNWNPSMILNDVAVMRIPEILTFTDLIQPIALPSGDELNDDFTGRTALASGYGLTVSGGSVSTNQVLSSVELTVIENQVCRAVFGEYIQDSTLCISGEGGKSTCQGDSGGPLAVDNGSNKVLVGITSFGSGLGCDVNAPAAFARVTSFVDFINSILSE